MIRCNEDCKACMNLNTRTDDKGYPFAYECMRYKEAVAPCEFTSTKEFETEK